MMKTSTSEQQHDDAIAALLDGTPLETVQERFPDVANELAEIASVQNQLTLLRVDAEISPNALQSVLNKLPDQRQSRGNDFMRAFFTPRRLVPIGVVAVLVLAVVAQSNFTAHKTPEHLALGPTTPIPDDLGIDQINFDDPDEVNVLAGEDADAQDALGSQLADSKETDALLASITELTK